MIRGAGYGLMAWMVYGLIEFVLTCIVPQFSSDLQISSWQWPLIAQILLVYIAAGAILGAVGGLLAQRLKWPVQSVRTFAHLTLVVAFIVNLIPAWPLARSEDIALAVAIVLAL